MKRNVFCSLFAVLMVSAFIVSCDPMEPTTYTDTFHRIASVKYKDGKASLLIDCTGENYIFSNFSTQADMDHFGLKDGDRIIARMTLEAVGHITNNKLYLDEVVRKYPKVKLAESKPADSLNYAFRFSTLSLISVVYPEAWSQGHILNIAPEYYVSEGNKKADFKLYPDKVQGDTLIMNLYADIPDTVTVLSMQQTFLCYDLASLRDPVSDPVEQAHRDTLLNQLTRLKQDSINVLVYAPDYMRKKIFRKTGEVDEVRFVNIPSAEVFVSLPFDF